MFFRQITDPKLAQYAYLIGCQATGEAIVIDPHRDIDQYLELAETEGLEIVAATETHIHADFVSGVREFAARGVRAYLSGEGGEDWRYEWPGKGDYDCVLVHDRDVFDIGNIRFDVVFTPGHTPEHICFLVTDGGAGANEPMGLVSGDFVFVGALGRPDLLEKAAAVAGAMEPSARLLHGSVERFLELPDFLQVWPGHGAGSACGKALGAVPDTTVGYERRFSPAIEAATRGQDYFVEYILEGQPEPPMYFARMKAWNRSGAPVLGGVPTPPHVSAATLEGLDPATAVVVDTRADRSEFMAGHLPGSLYIPLTNAFNTAAGSVITDEGLDIYLVVEDESLDGAVRDLLRVGLDRVAGYTTPGELRALFAAGGASASIPEMGFHGALETLASSPGVVLDVRYASEFAAGHVPGAINASYTRLPDYRERLDAVGPGRTLLVHCQSGARAAVASSWLAREGYDVGYVNDLWPAYAASHDVEKGEAVAV
ncbi:MAG: rhodanese-like domain-containing protein [Gemmatimonadota bacterium]|nr:rhodanese-like domain-containing protein [Gemmatimonadota bacterium]